MKRDKSLRCIFFFKFEHVLTIENQEENQLGKLISETKIFQVFEASSRAIYVWLAAPLCMRFMSSWAWWMLYGSTNDVEVSLVWSLNHGWSMWTMHVCFWRGRFDAFDWSFFVMFVAFKNPCYLLSFWSSDFFHRSCIWWVLGLEYNYATYLLDLGSNPNLQNQLKPTYLKTISAWFLCILDYDFYLILLFVCDSITLILLFHMRLLMDRDWMPQTWLKEVAWVGLMHTKCSTKCSN